MSRSTLTTAQKNLLTGQNLKYFWAVVFEFPSETSRMWSGIGDKVIGGETYQGTGSLLKIGDVVESGELGAYNTSLSLSGVPSDLLSLALSIDYRNSKCTIKQGFSGGSVSEFVSDVYIGFVDSMNIVEGADTSTITVSLESALAVLTRRSSLRYSDANQRARFSNDKGMEFIESLQNRAIAWGADGNATLQAS